MKPIIFIEGEDPDMQVAHKNAQASFKYFWRELSWERRRIISALSASLMKFAFTDGKRKDNNPEYEHMWVSMLGFDGVTISGKLVSTPNWLKTIKSNDSVRRPLKDLEDWMMVSQGKAYGGYTVNVLRSKMSRSERKSHDQAWGLDFGNPGRIRVELSSEENKSIGLISSIFGSRKINTYEEHSLGIKMLDKLEIQLKKNPSFATSTDDNGFTLFIVNQWLVI